MKADIFKIVIHSILATLFSMQVYAENQEIIIEEKPMVVVIPSYNNKDWYKKNLDSVFMQDYQNYRVIYINDASPDGTGDLVSHYIETQNLQDKITLINNPDNMGAMANHYKAAHLCQDHEIIINLDGDDWFKDPHVLQRINKAYQDENVWLTYGQYEELHFSQTKKRFFTKTGHCAKIPDSIVRAHAYREHSWVTTHLRTFYAGLMKQIQPKDLLFNGQFFPVSCDMAFMYPMLEMTGGKFAFIDDILYQYNCITPFNDHKRKLLQQMHTTHIIRSKQKYLPRKHWSRNIPQNAHADIIILSKDNPTQLYALLESIYTHMSGIDEIYVLYKTKTEDAVTQYEKLTTIFTKVTFIPIDNNLKNILELSIKTTKNNYIMLAQDNLLVKSQIDISSCIAQLEKSYAYGFYCNLGKNIIESPYLLHTDKEVPCVQIEDNIYAWQFLYGQQEWRMPHNFSMTLYRKKDLLTQIENLHYDTKNGLEKIWNKQQFDLENIGLFFEKSKIIEVKVREKEKLNTYLKNGLKISLASLYAVENNCITISTQL